MDSTPLILIGLAIIFLFSPKPTRQTKPSWSQHLHGWQKILGIVACILALLIIMNPEFLALGILGDATFFDFLVLALSFQMQALIVRTWRSLAGAFSRSVKWLGIPSPGLRYLMSSSAAMIAGTIAAIQKIWDRN